MDDKKNTEGVFAIDGLKPVEPNALAQFQQQMKDEVIPEVVDTVEKRRLKAAESRRWQLKC